MYQDDDEEIIPSKSQKKREMAELQDLGEELAVLPMDHIKKMGLDENLYNALVEIQKMPRHDEARRRQMQYIGKIMRKIDPEPIRAVLSEIRGQSAEETARLHRLEQLRERLLENESVLSEIVSLYPSCDLQHLRALRRAALKEKEQNKPPRNFRSIFQYIKSLAEEARKASPEN